MYADYARSLAGFLNLAIVRFSFSAGLFFANAPHIQSRLLHEAPLLVVVEKFRSDLKFI